ncbi:gamma-glutamylcyclotransferase family protein [Rhodopseudomonas sp. B29]|uniref:gamma-glutamylcyclotransferase family protein n=1 Tax=Rhodopseudomonas sp. B29 TaxID=95607 RepID=UPI000349EE0D|nr:gamma-glutamylcyclotransferase family protein [Rhodopseudomonas sp. B29]
MNRQDRKAVLHFAYGADMNPEQIAERCSGAKVVAVARLPDYALSFHGQSQVWDGGEEAAVPRPGCHLYGVVYRLSPSDADRLDAAQGVRLNGTGGYFHYPADVIGLDGNRWNVVLHKKDVLREFRSPSREYLDFIVAGAQFHRLPVDYIEGLRAIDAAPASYPVPHRAVEQFRILSTSSCAC